MTRKVNRSERREAVPTVPDEPPLLEPVPGGPPAPEVAIDAEVVNRPAVVTIRIPGGKVPGEVRLFVRGTYESLIAYSREPLDSGRHVVVVRSRGERAVQVEPTTRGT